MVTEREGQYLCSPGLTAGLSVPWSLRTSRRVLDGVVKYDAAMLCVGLRVCGGHCMLWKSGHRLFLHYHLISGLADKSSRSRGIYAQGLHRLCTSGGPGSRGLRFRTAGKTAVVDS